MTNQPSRGSSRSKAAKRDPKEWHGHRIVTEDDLGAVFVADDDGENDRLVRRARRRRIRHGVVLGVLIVVVAAAALFAQAVREGRLALPQPGGTPVSAQEGCPAGPFSYQAATSVTVNVFNSTATPGLANSAAESLSQRGFSVGTVGNASLNREGMTAVIRSGPAGQQAAYTLQQHIPDTEYVADDRTDATVDVILGSGFSSLAPAAQAEAAGPGPLSCPRMSPPPGTPAQTPAAG